MTANSQAAGLAIDDPGGDGRPFLWAHGLTSSRAAEDATGLFPWSTIVGLRVIRYDARGHGASAGPLDPAAYTWPALAADLVAVLDTVGLDRCALGGASMGCATVLAATVAAPRRVDRLVLVTPPTAWATRAPQRAAYADNAELVERSGVAALAERNNEEQPPPVLGATGELVRRDGLARLEAMDPNVLAQILRGAAASDLPAEAAIAEIAQPALVLAWADDAGHPVSTADMFAATMPNATLHVAHDLAAIRRWPALVHRFLVDAPPV